MKAQRAHPARRARKESKVRETSFFSKLKLSLIAVLLVLGLIGHKGLFVCCKLTLEAILITLTIKNLCSQVKRVRQVNNETLNG